MNLKKNAANDEFVLTMDKEDYENFVQVFRDYIEVENAAADQIEDDDYAHYMIEDFLEKLDAGEFDN